MMRNKGGAVESENIRPIPREPTEAMTEAGLMAIGTPGCYVDEVWRAMWDASPPIPAASAPKGAEPQRWRHIKTGGVYEVIVDHAYVEADMTAVVVYRGETGMTFTRPSSEFHDGRFELLDGAPTDRASHGAEPTTGERPTIPTIDAMQLSLDAIRKTLDDCRDGEVCMIVALEMIHNLSEEAAISNNPPEPTTGVDPGAETLWQPIEIAPHGRKLIVGYPNALGNWRTVIAVYHEANTLQARDDEDEMYAEPGWYEECESNPDGYVYPTDEPPTHWMPLAPAPGASPPTTGEADLLREIDELLSGVPATDDFGRMSGWDSEAVKAFHRCRASIESLITRRYVLHSAKYCPHCGATLQGQAKPEGDAREREQH